MKSKTCYETHKNCNGSECSQSPRVGMKFNHPTLGNCKIIAVHPMGTIDVQNIWTENCYRISGLPLA